MYILVEYCIAVTFIHTCGLLLLLTSACTWYLLLKLSGAAADDVATSEAAIDCYLLLAVAAVTVSKLFVAGPNSSLMYLLL